MASLTQNELRSRLDKLLDAGLTATAELSGLLKAERRALEQQDSEALEGAAAAKGQCLEALELLENERSALLKNANFPDDHAGMDALQDWCDPGGMLQTRWHRYLEVAGECRQANMTNGAILRLRHQQIASALATLSGRRPETYGPSGMNGGGSSRALAEA